MNWLNPSTWLLYGALAAALVLGAWRLDVSRQQVGYDRAQAEYTTAALRATEAARAREQQLQAEAANITKVKDEKIAAVNSRLVAALSQLRNRPERRDPVAINPPDCKGATGSELSRPDAGFLVGEAARADTIKAGLEACYAQYDSLATARP